MIRTPLSRIRGVELSNSLSGTPCRLITPLVFRINYATNRKTMLKISTRMTNLTRCRRIKASLSTQTVSCSYDLPLQPMGVTSNRQLSVLVVSYGLRGADGERPELR